MFIGERGHPGRIELVEVAIENVEAEVAHLRPSNAQRLQRLADGAGRRLLVLVVVVLNDERKQKEILKLSSFY